jgi:ABC-type nickel/cobalt efflux system permease component RcnA
MTRCVSGPTMRTVMTLAPHPRSTVANLLRLLAVWVAAIVLVQGIGAAQALGRGPLHRHVEASAAQHDDHHHHRVAERHHHATVDASVLPVGQDIDFDAVAFALTAALGLVALGHWRFAADTRRHVWRAALAWAWRTSVPALLLRPPKQS